jgi:hypothetical protein
VNSFERFLLAINRESAVLHLIDCLVAGPKGNQAWDLMEEFNGSEWRCEPQELVALLYKTLSSLEEKSKSLSAVENGQN